MRGRGPYGQNSATAGTSTRNVNATAEPRNRPLVSSGGGMATTLVCDFAEHAEAVDARIARGAQLVGRQLLEFAQVFQQRGLDRGGDGLRIAVRTTHGLRQHFVD